MVYVRVYISNLPAGVQAAVFAEPSSLRTVTKVGGGGRGGTGASVYICIVYIYIYIERERVGERGMCTHIQ